MSDKSFTQIVIPGPFVWGGTTVQIDEWGMYKRPREVCSPEQEHNQGSHAPHQPQQQPEPHD